MYGLSFMIRNGQEQKFFEYLISQANPSALEKKLNEIIAERPILNSEYDSVQIIHHNNLNTLIPSAFLNPETNRDILKQNVRLLPNDPVSQDYIKSIDAYNLYVPYKKISLNKHQTINNLHSATHFFNSISNIRIELQNLPVFEVFVNLFPSDFQIAVFKNEQLLAYNHFDYQTTDDFLYFLFFIFETLDIKEHQSRIYLIGTDETDDIMENLKDFTENLQILPKKNPSQIYNFF